MDKSLVRRLSLIPLILVSINFAGFMYAHLAAFVQKNSNPWGSAVASLPDIFFLYGNYLSKWLLNDLGKLPISEETIAVMIQKAAGASITLLIAGFIISLSVGLPLGMLAVRIYPIRVSRWLSPLSAIGMAVPAFFIATLFFAGSILYVLNQGENAVFPLPLSGYGLDEHIILPLVCMIIRPIALISRSTAAFLAEELEKPYITTARSIGNPWITAKHKHGFRNIIAPLTMTISSTLRWTTAELILVEWIFQWPGLGRLLAKCLIPPQTAGPQSLGEASVYFLNPDLLAALLTIFSAIFLIVDFLAAAFVHLADPRVGKTNQETFNG